MAVSRKEYIPSWKEMGSTAQNINVGKTERVASVVGGAALSIYGLTRKSLSGKALSLAGGYLFYRGTTGRDPLYTALGVSTNKAGVGINIEKSVMINRGPEEVYRFWHNFENLPRFMEHLESVKIISDRRSHWVASVPGGINFEWDAEMTEDMPNERISWRSLPEGEVQNQGTVEFRRALGGGTELRFWARYYVPGVVGAAASKLFEYLSAKQIERELNQFKNMIESGQMQRAA